MKTPHVNNVSFKMVKELFPDDSQQRLILKFSCLDLAKTVSRAIREKYGEYKDAIIMSSMIIVDGVAFELDAGVMFVGQSETITLIFDPCGVGTAEESEVTADEIK